MTTPLADGLDEAGRGLWRSAIESLSAAAEADPSDPAPVLALAVCHLLRGTPELALVLLETRKALAHAGPPWALRRDWLVAAARLSLGDVWAAERAIARLPEPWATQARATLRLTAGDYPGGLALLLAHRRPQP